MKSFPFIVCIVVGVWVGYYLGVNRSNETLSEHQVAQSASVTAAPDDSLKSIEDENAILKQQLVDLEDQLVAIRELLTPEQAEAFGVYLNERGH